MSSESDNTVIKVKLIPRSSSNQIVGLLDDGTLKIKLTSPPVEGKANLALIKYLAEKLNLNLDNIEIISGRTSHNKLLSIRCLQRAEILSLLIPPEK